MNKTLRTYGDEQIEAFILRTRDAFGDSLSDEFMAELVISYVFRRDAYNTTGLHHHECMSCGRVNECHSEQCATSGDFFGEDTDDCGHCVWPRDN